MNRPVSKSAFHAIVRGRVQGVCFRMETADRATELGVTGWVRNLPDRSVEVWAEGLDDALEQLGAWLQNGPPLALVESVEFDTAEVTDDHAEFRIRS